MATMEEEDDDEDTEQEDYEVGPCTTVEKLLEKQLEKKMVVNGSRTK